MSYFLLQDFIYYNYFMNVFFPGQWGEDFLILKIFLFCQFVLTIFSWIIFIIQLLKNNDAIKKLKPEMSELSYLQFFLMIIFSLLVAIPSKIFVNNKLSLRFRCLCIAILSVISYGEYMIAFLILPICFFIFVNKLVVFLFENISIFKNDSFYKKYVKFFFYGSPKRIGHTIPFNTIMFSFSLTLQDALSREEFFLMTQVTGPAVQNLKNHLFTEGSLSRSEIRERTFDLIDKIIREEGFLILPFNRGMSLDEKIVLFSKKCISFLPSDFSGQYLYIYFVISCIMVGISIYLFIGIIEKNKPFFSLLKIKFNRLNFINKLLLVIFSLIYGIPNLVYINLSQAKLRSKLILLTSTIFGFFVPIFHFIVCFYFILVLQSFSVAFLYEKNNRSKYIIDLLLFGGDSDFAKFYFDFFWGNMSKGSKKVGEKVSEAATAIGIEKVVEKVFNAVKSDEENDKEELERRTESRTNNNITAHAEDFVGKTTQQKQELVKELGEISRQQVTAEMVEEKVIYNNNVLQTVNDSKATSPGSASPARTGGNTTFAGEEPASVDDKTVLSSVAESLRNVFSSESDDKKPSGDKEGNNGVPKNEEPGVNSVMEDRWFFEDLTEIFQFSIYFSIIYFVVRHRILFYNYYSYIKLMFFTKY